jgi:hypothetical protein
MVEGRPSDDDADPGEVYLCPICNTKVSATSDECPRCGAIFVDDEDDVEVAKDKPSPPPEAEMEMALEYRCPACGGSVREDDETCPHCDALFVDDEAEVTEEPEAPAPEAPRERPKTRPSSPKAEARAKTRPSAREPPQETTEWEVSRLDGLKVPSLGVRGKRQRTAATRSRVRHSQAVMRLSQRRKLIAKRRMFGLGLLGLGFAVYIGSLLVSKPEGLTMSSVGILAVSVILIILGVLIIYNQHQAWQHFRNQLQTARIESALLRERTTGAPVASDGGAATRRAPPTPPPKARPKKATPPVAQTKVTPTQAQVAPAESPPPTKKKVVTGAASTVDGRVRPTRVPSQPVEEVEMEPSRPEDRDKVPCPNCGYMNRSIFVRCIRCGTELASKEESISVETFERPEAPSQEESPRPRGGPMPWEARHASSQGGRAAARQAARQAAKAEAEDEETEDRRAAIGVAANFSKLPKNMREELIRTLYKVSDAVVRQDTVSAIAEHYTELPKDIQDLLVDLADDEDPRVREEVAFEVNRNFDRIPLSIIQTVFSKLAKDPENLVREDVVSAIAENFQRLPKETQDLLKELARDQEESVRDEVSFEVAKNSDVIPEKFKSEIKETLRRAGS